MTMLIFKINLTLIVWCILLLAFHAFIKAKPIRTPENADAKRKVLKILDFLFGVGLIAFLIAFICLCVSFIWNVLP